MGKHPPFWAHQPLSKTSSAVNLSFLLPKEGHIRLRYLYHDYKEKNTTHSVWWCDPECLDLLRTNTTITPKIVNKWVSLQLLLSTIIALNVPPSEISTDNLNRSGRHRIAKNVIGNFDGLNPLGLAKVISSKRTYYYVTSKGSTIEYPALLIDDEGQRRFQESAQKLEESTSFISTWSSEIPTVSAETIPILQQTTSYGVALDPVSTSAAHILKEDVWQSPEYRKLFLSDKEDMRNVHQELRHRIQFLQSALQALINDNQLIPQLARLDFQLTVAKSLHETTKFSTLEAETNELVTTMGRSPGKKKTQELSASQRNPRNKPKKAKHQPAMPATLPARNRKIPRTKSPRQLAHTSATSLPVGDPLYLWFYWRSR